MLVEGEIFHYHIIAVGIPVIRKSMNNCKDRKAKTIIVCVAGKIQITIV